MNQSVVMYFSMLLLVAGRPNRRMYSPFPDTGTVFYKSLVLVLLGPPSMSIKLQKLFRVRVMLTATGTAQSPSPILDNNIRP